MACSSSRSSTSSKIGCKFYPRIGVRLAAAAGGGAALSLY
jgi:hypothetical protein